MSTRDCCVELLRIGKRHIHTTQAAILNRKCQHAQAQRQVQRRVSQFQVDSFRFSKACLLHLVNTATPDRSSEAGAPCPVARHATCSPAAMACPLLQLAAQRATLLWSVEMSSVRGRTGRSKRGTLLSRPTLLHHCLPSLTCTIQNSGASLSRRLSNIRPSVGCP